MSMENKYKDKKGINYVDGKLCAFITAERYNKKAYLELFCSKTFDIVFIERDIYSKIIQDDKIWGLIIASINSNTTIDKAIMVF